MSFGPRRITVVAIGVALLLVTNGKALATPLIPAGHDPELSAKAEAQQRQFDEFNAHPFGLSLNVDMKDIDARARVSAYLAQSETTPFMTFDGTHQHELMNEYGEYGDLGFFGGVALVGTAFRYLALKQEGAPENELAPARANVERAARSWHVFYRVTGGKGVLARGIQRVVPENPEDAPIPLSSEGVIPLADENGNPLPAPKSNGSLRTDMSQGELPAGEWRWVDSASKDQLIGQMLGMVVLYEAIKDDLTIDQKILQELAQDAKDVAHVLMTKREILGMEGLSGQGEYDLIIMDADGRATMYHDLNPLSLEKIYLPEDTDSYNLFNLFMAIGTLKAMHHVSGDPEIEAFLYEELLGRRGFLEKARDWRGDNAFNYIYMDKNTNTDNPDLTSVALFITLFCETDPEIRAVWQDFLEEGWWNREGQFQTAARSKQPFWHAIYLAMTERGTSKALVEELSNLIKGFPMGPYWDDRVQNCDAEELAAMKCVAVDNKTILNLVKVENGNALADEALDPRIRPPSDFNARSNPFGVNGGGNGLRLNPGGDILAAYWMARYFNARETGESQVSAHARDHMSVWSETEPTPETTPEEKPDAIDDSGDQDATEPETIVGDMDAVTDSTTDNATAPDVTANDQGPAGDSAVSSTTSDGCSGSSGSTSLPVASVMLLIPLIVMTIRRRFI